MSIVLTLANGNTAITNVSNAFTMAMVQDCFLGKDFKGYGVVTGVEKSAITVY